MTPERGRPAGWYDDPSTGSGQRHGDAALLRYWDGSNWSPHTAPKPALDDRVDEVAGHTVRLRAPDEHTTVPLPPEHAGPAASTPWISRTVGQARRIVGGQG